MLRLRCRGVQRWDSSDVSSLMPEEEPRGLKLGGGVRLFSSVKDSQNSLPLELRITCCLKLPDSWELDASTIRSSSGMPSRESCVAPIIGDERGVSEVDIEG